jgi:hypothetical protein
MEVDLEKVKVYNPVKMNEGVYCSKIMINSEELQFQLPKNVLTLNKEKKKCTISVEKEEIHDLIKSISELIITKTSESSEKWFGKLLSFEECKQIYKEALLDNLLYCFYDENTNFYNNSEREIDPDTLDTELKGIALIKCGLIVFTKTSFFIRWEVSQFKIKKEKTKNVEDILMDYSIRDLEEHDEPLEEAPDVLSKKIENITLF